MSETVEYQLVYELWSSRQPNQRLNMEQTEAVKAAMQNKFQFIQGPPGNTY